MGIPVLIMGESGSGKTYSIKNFDADEVGIFSVEKNRLPFPKKFNVLKHATYPKILKSLSNHKLKSYVIDDSQYLIINEYFDKAKEAGYQKFTDMALNFRNLIHYINEALPEDIIVYFLHHTDSDAISGKLKAKTLGKMLDDKLTVEGCFDIVLLCEADGNEHCFTTQSEGRSTAKSPEGMFPAKIPNDLKAVDMAIRGYWELSDEEVETEPTFKAAESKTTK